MRQVLELFAYDQRLVTDALVEQRYLATLRSGTASAFRSAFHEPFQDVLDSACLPEQDLRGVRQPTLIIHGREDRIVPVETSLALGTVITGARVHIIERCGHWTAVEHTDELLRLLSGFLAED
jgi:pimeloyl-ACP methyl ester carboxylesterase